MDKGKGKARDGSNDHSTRESNRALRPGQREDGNLENDSDADSRTLLRSILQSAQIYDTQGALSSMLSSTEKGSVLQAVPAAASTAVRDTLEKIRSGSLSASTDSPGSAYRAFRSNVLKLEETSADDDFREFARQVRSWPEVSAASPPWEARGEAASSTSASAVDRDLLQRATIGQYSSSTQLDAQFHAYLRELNQHRSSQQPSDGSQDQLGIAWTDAQAVTRPEALQLTDADYHDAWTRSIPAPSFGQLGRFTSDESARGDNFDALQQQSLDDTLHVANTFEQEMNGDFMAALDDEDAKEHAQINLTSAGLSSHWRPPTPSQHPDMTFEQYNLHRSLAQEQDHGKYSAEERICPPDDDPTARTGVYAATPEDALQAIWAGQDEGERASVLVREQASQGTDSSAPIAQRVRRILARGSYVDDVYGLPPALEATIKLAEQPESADNRELRSKALARLDALYRHLDGAAPASREQEMKSFVRDW